MTTTPLAETSACEPIHRKRIFVVGATGTAGRAVARTLLKQGHEVVCFVRSPGPSERAKAPGRRSSVVVGAVVRFGDVTEPRSIVQDGFRGEHFDAVISCMASRTGKSDDAWTIDHRAHLHLLEAAQGAGVGHFILLSAICVQKPVLAFQHAKLAFEKALIASGVRYSIVRPTAFFKSLSGQIERVRRGKPYLIFGDGAGTACLPISDDDLADYIVACLDEPSRWNCVLPIGGPAPPITPREQGERLFALLGKAPQFRSVPFGLLDAIVYGLSVVSRVLPSFAAKAELARIGRYYATESMLVLDPRTGRYDAEATPTTGRQTLFDFYADVLAGAEASDLGDHAVFARERRATNVAERRAAS